MDSPQVKRLTLKKSGSTPRRRIAANAAQAFREGRLEDALNLYRLASDSIGDTIFSANIAICERRLKASSPPPIDACASMLDLRVACVMDEFTFHSYEPECILRQITPDNSLQELADFSPDILFVESAWQGIKGAWNRKISNLSKELKSALDWCNGKNIPTVFWNKEDPVHFETFLGTAQKFDFVFTTDIDCIARYKLALGHERVFLLPFACQPKLHNPIEVYERKDSFCFAGAYYARYSERTRDLEEYIKELPEYKPLEIFDRNYGNTDEAYRDHRFPDIFQPYIIGRLPFTEINKAYKGYKYAINLNSIKQSQTMFARRAYELLACNTFTVSNFSRGLRLMFGDLLVSSDSAREIVKRLEKLDSIDEEKIKIAGLRKIMLEHTYRHRLSYVISKSMGRELDHGMPTMVAIANVKCHSQLDKFIKVFSCQAYPHKRALVIFSEPSDISTSVIEPQTTVEVVQSADDAISRFAEFAQADCWIAPFVSSDYYGPNYLIDLAIATIYSGASLVGKSSFFINDGFKLRLVNREYAFSYRPSQDFSMRASAIKAYELFKITSDSSWLYDLETGSWPIHGFSIDSFNYACNAQSLSLGLLQDRVDDLVLDTGISCNELLKAAETIKPASRTSSSTDYWTPKQFLFLLENLPKTISFTLISGGLLVKSQLAEGTHEYIYSAHEIPFEDLSKEGFDLQSHLQSSPGLNIQYVFIYLDKNKQKISHDILGANQNFTVSAPPNTAYLRFGLRIYGSGSSVIKALNWSHIYYEPPAIMSNSKYILVTNQYPSYQDLYRYGFVHSRLLAYKALGISVDVFRLRNDEVVSYHEFQNIDCITGSSDALEKLLSTNRYEAVLVHFLSQDTWSVLSKYIGRLRVIVWVHGAEIQPWHRRNFNYNTEAERKTARLHSDKRISFWRGLLKSMHPRLHLVFVSKYLAEEVMCDLDVRLPNNSFSVIHNPIDTDLFRYRKKPHDQRFKILSIRSFASRIYANDLLASAIFKLSQADFFDKLEFRIIGDGWLFEEIIAPLRIFDNVLLERRFLVREEISDLHRDYGIFLCPSRGETQGVSRDEAMSSGLVPVTTNVAAIPEFVDQSCGYLADPEDAESIARAVAELVENPDLFAAKSCAAAERVRLQSRSQAIIDAELSLINGTLN